MRDELKKDQPIDGVKISLPVCSRQGCVLLTGLCAPGFLRRAQHRGRSGSPGLRNIHRAARCPDARMTVGHWVTTDEHLLEKLHVLNDRVRVSSKVTCPVTT